jgi:hypothetical protein
VEKPIKVKSRSFKKDNQLVKVLCERIVVGADGRLAGLAETPAVISDDL